MRCPKCDARLHEQQDGRSSQMMGFSCWRCGFWVDSDKAKGVVVATQKKRENGRLCKASGCQKYISREGLCKQHWNEKQAVAPVVVSDDLSQIHDSGDLVNSDGDKVSFGVDELLYKGLTNALAELEARWLVELSGLKPMTAICRAAQMIDAVRGL